MPKQSTLIQGFPDRLREAISKTGLSPHQVQKRSRIEQMTFYNYINGASGPSGLSVAKLAVTLGVSADWLLGLESVS